jgi:hypothetical protein
MSKLDEIARQIAEGKLARGEAPVRGQTASYAESAERIQHRRRLAEEQEARLDALIRAGGPIRRMGFTTQRGIHSDQTTLWFEIGAWRLSTHFGGRAEAEAGRAALGALSPPLALSAIQRAIGSRAMFVKEARPAPPAPTVADPTCPACPCKPCRDARRSRSKRRRSCLGGCPCYDCRRK